MTTPTPPVTVLTAEEVEAVRDFFVFNGPEFPDVDPALTNVAGLCDSHEQLRADLAAEKEVSAGLRALATPADTPCPHDPADLPVRGCVPCADRAFDHLQQRLSEEIARAEAFRADLTVERAVLRDLLIAAGWWEHNTPGPAGARLRLALGAARKVLYPQGLPTGAPTPTLPHGEGGAAHE